MSLRLSICLLVLAHLWGVPSGTRLKDLVSIEGVRDNQLVGYGLVVGLAGTGDKTQTVFSAQSLTDLLARMGIQVNPKYGGSVGDRRFTAFRSTGNAHRYFRGRDR